jgi:flagellar biosynthesis regulator FlaF
MHNSGNAMRAYAAAATARDPRQREAEVFRRTNAYLRLAKQVQGLARVRALADNRLLWRTVIDLMYDPANALPLALRAEIVSIGLAVQREMGKSAPDFELLAAINENIAAGLARDESSARA